VNYRFDFIGIVIFVGALSAIASQTGQTGQTGTGQTGTPQTGTPQTGKPQSGTPQAGTGSSQPGSMGSTSQDGSARASGLALQRGDKLLGMEVQDASGAKVGQIDDLVLRSDGSIAYATLAKSGDTTGKLYPVPWRALEVRSLAASSGAANGGNNPDATPSSNTRPDVVVLRGDAKRLESAPSFERSAWPKANETVIFSKADEFYGQSGEPMSGATRKAETGGRPVEAGAARDDSTTFRATQLRNQMIADSSGAALGTLGQIVYDPRDGRVSYVAVAVTNAPGVSGRTIAVPWSTLRSSRQDERNRFQLTTPTDRLQGAPQFRTGDNEWRQMSDPAWVEQMYSYYSVKPYWHGAGSSAHPPGAGRQLPGDTKPANPNGDPQGGAPQGGVPQGGAPKGGDPKGGDTSGSGGEKRPPQ
jgi:sporulation protein YlmC with PRC-barrel domain